MLGAFAARNFKFQLAPCGAKECKVNARVTIALGPIGARAPDPLPIRAILQPQERSNFAAFALLNARYVSG
jgi:hypothetical protein